MATAANPTAQLRTFLAKFSPEIAAQARAIFEKNALPVSIRTGAGLRQLQRARHRLQPHRTRSEGIFSIAIYPNWINLFFLQGKTLPDPKKILQGSGNQVRHIRLTSPDTLDGPPIVALMSVAVAHAKVSFDTTCKHRLIIRAIAAKQRPRRSAKSV